MASFLLFIASVGLGHMVSRPDPRLSSCGQNASPAQDTGSKQLQEGTSFPSLMLAPLSPWPSAPLGRLCTLSVFA